jgi:hypothetical protein
MTAVSLLLSAWLGAAILFSSVVAPAAFAALPSRTLAGALVGRILPSILVAGMVIAAASLALDRRAGGRQPRVRRAALVVTALACAAAQFVVGPRIDRIRSQIDGPIEQLPAGDARRVTFGRLHALSVAWLGVAMLSAGTALVLASLSPRINALRTSP